MPAEPLFDYSQFDYDNPKYDLAEIRRINPQRYEMEQLTGVVHIDQERRGVVGFKEVTDQEFWVAGHMPDFPLMPGVVQCECGAQLAGFYARSTKLLGGAFIGFGGMSEVRFRRPIYPGCRLILMALVTKVRPNRLVHFNFQGFVDDKLMFSGAMTGVSINPDQRASQ